MSWEIVLLCIVIIGQVCNVGVMGLFLQEKELWLKMLIFFVPFGSILLLGAIGFHAFVRRIASSLQNLTED